MSEDVPSAAIATTGRSTVAVRPGAARRQASTIASTVASCRAYTNSTSGRRMASSVSGTGLLA